MARSSSILGFAWWVARSVVWSAACFVVLSLSSGCGASDEPPATTATTTDTRATDTTTADTTTDVATDTHVAAPEGHEAGNGSSSAGAGAGAAEADGEGAPEAEPPADCADAARARRAVAVALGAATAAGVRATLLDGCAFDADRCHETGDEASADAGQPNDGARCVVDVDTMGGYFAIRVQPRAQSDAPRFVEVNVDAGAREALRTWVSASAWAVGRRSDVVVGGVDGRASHTHGGEPAHIGRAVFEVWNRGARPVSVSVARLAWLTAASCDGPLSMRARPAVAGLTIEDGTTQTARVTIAPGRATLTVWFAVQPAYYAYCDRFAARATFDVGGEAITSTAEQIVMRREPLRRRDP